VQLHWHGMVCWGPKLLYVVLTLIKGHGHLAVYRLEWRENPFPAALALVPEKDGCFGRELGRPFNYEVVSHTQLETRWLG
jgi:hypothetical protein